MVKGSSIIADDEAPMMFQPQAMMKHGGARAPAQQDLGMDVQHSKLLHVNVEICYRISEF
jgi:hypothetical protein